MNFLSRPCRDCQQQGRLQYHFSLRAQQRPAAGCRDTLPIVSRENPHHLLGVVRRNDIVRAYEVGAVRREEARQWAEASRAMKNTRAEFVDVSLSPHSRALGKTVAELDLSREAVLVSIRRGRELIIPHGDTQLQAGDVVTALSEREDIPQLKAILNQLDTTSSEKP